MNFQAVSVGEKLIENSTNPTGGYEDGVGTPTAPLLNEIIFVDNAIGKFVAELKKRGLYQTIAIIITAKHGQSPIDPNRVLRIPAVNYSAAPVFTGFRLCANHRNKNIVLPINNIHR